MTRVDLLIDFFVVVLPFQTSYALRSFLAQDSRDLLVFVAQDAHFSSQVESS